jgi:hypothetical protein
MTICPTLSLSSPMGTKSVPKIDVNHKDDYIYKQQEQQKKHLRKKRTSLLKFVYCYKENSSPFKIIFLDCQQLPMI